jgi:hypothetical protein
VATGVETVVGEEEIDNKTTGTTNSRVIDKSFYKTNAVYNTCYVQHNIVYAN